MFNSGKEVSMIYGITLIILGCLAIPSLILSKRPDAKVAFDKIAPYQGVIGIIFALWGIWGIIQCFMYISLLTAVPVLWIIWLIVSIVEAALGFILGYGLISKNLLSKNATAAAKGEQLLQKLLPFQGKLGIVAIILGIIQIIASIVYTVGA